MGVRLNKVLTELNIGFQTAIDFLKNNHISYPVLMDTTGEYFYLYGASSLPTSWFIRPDGSLIGYINGALTKEQLLDFLKQCVDF